MKKNAMPLLKNENVYAVTIAPDDHLQHLNESGRTRWALVGQSVLSDLLPLAPYIKNINIFPDLSAPPAFSSKSFPRIHYHGTIEFSDVIMAYTNWHKHMLHYRVEIDTIKDREVWRDYEEKFIRRFPKYTLYNITTKQLNNLTPSNTPTEKVNIVELCNKYDVDYSSDED